MTDPSRDFCLRSAILSGAVLLLLAAQAGQAQESRYSSDWRQTPSPTQAGDVPGRSAELDSLLRELEKLTGEAERGRAADPRFLADLKDLMRRYSWPWHTLVVADDFRDGDYLQNPSWAVSAGSFRVNPDGLVTRVTPAARAADTGQAPEPQQQNPDDFARQLLGGVLRELSRDRRRDDPKPVQQEASEARIHLERAIPNRFAVRVELQSRTTTQGRLELGVGQGPNGLGYFLVYSPGASPALSLVRKGSRGSAVIDSVPDRIGLEDGRAHVLLLTRDGTGDMTASLDGETKFRVVDRAFRSPFDRFVIANGGGDFTIRAVAVYGAP